MKMKKILTSVIMTGVMLATAVPVGATNIVVDSDSKTGQTPTEFEVTSEMLGGDLVVTVPDSMVLDYDSTNAEFSKTAQVTAKGSINPSKKLKVTVPTSITYTHADDSNITAAGTITFGSTDGVNQQTEWSVAELQTKDGATLVGVSKDITSTVPLTNVQYIGDYNSTINFDINVVAAN